jgi:hypothetical protein
MPAVGVKAGAAGGPGGKGAAGAKGASQRGKGGKNKKKKHKCGDSGSYGKMKDNFKAAGMERDHIPSGAALVERGGNMLGKPLCESQANAVKRAASACAIPKGVHREFSLTCGSSADRNSPSRIASDGSAPPCGPGKGLQNAAERDTKAVQKGLRETGASKECRKAYAKWAKEVRGRDDNWYKGMIKKALPEKAKSWR